MTQATIEKDYPIRSELTEKEKQEYSIDTSKIIIKCPFEGNRKYRDYWLHEIMPDGTEEHFYYVNKIGKKTHCWFEKLIDGKWQHVESIPHDAFLKILASVENDNIIFTKECTNKERDIIVSSLAFALEA